MHQFVILPSYVPQTLNQEMSNQNKTKKWYLKNVIVLLLLERHVKGWVPMYVDKK
jgi:hypothetical protein